MRFFTSFRYVQNDSKLGWYGHLGGLVLRRSRKTNPPKCESIQEPVNPMRSGDPHKINRTVLSYNYKKATLFLEFYKLFSRASFKKRLTGCKVLNDSTNFPI